MKVKSYKVEGKEPTWRYPSLGALLDYVDSVPKHQRGQSVVGSREWAGATPKGAMELARKGWAEGARKAGALSTRLADRLLQHTAEAEVTEVAYAVQGAAYDPGAYMSGIPECWLSFEPVKAKAGIYIAMGVNASCSVKPETLITRGIAVAALIQALTAAGHPVTVDTHLQDKKGQYAVTTRIHDGASGTVLDVDRLVYCLAHPSFLRRITSVPVEEYRNGLWGWNAPLRDGQQPSLLRDKPDLWLGVGHINDVARWRDGGEAWVLKTYLEQTKA